MKSKWVRPGTLRAQMALGLAIKVIGAGSSFVFTWLIARTFGPTGVGGFSTALTTATMAMTLALMGLDFILIRAVAVLKTEGRTGSARTVIRDVMRVSLTVGAIIALVLVLVRDWLAVHVLGSAQFAPYILILSLIIPGMVFSRLASSALRGVGQIGSSQSVDGPIGTSVAALGLLVAIAFGAAHSALLPPILYVAGWLVADFYAGWALSRTMRNWQPAEAHDEKLMTSGLFILAANFSNLFIDWFPTVILAATQGPAAAGIFRIGYQIAVTLRLLATTSEAVLQPVFAASYRQGDLARIARIARRTILALGLASLPIVVAVFVAPHWIMSLFGKDFVAGATAMQVLVCGQVMGLVMGAPGAIIVMARREALGVIFTLAGAILSAVLALWLIPTYGVLGAAIAASVPFVFVRLEYIAAVRWVVGVRLW